MKKKITVLSMVLISSLFACHNAEHKHNDESKDTAETHEESAIDQDTSAKGLNGMDALINCQDAKTMVTDFVAQAVPDGSGGHQVVLGNNAPIAWKIPVSDIQALAGNNDDVIAMLSFENGKYTLVLGGLENDGDAEPDIAQNANFETFPPIRELADYFPSGTMNTDFIDNILFKNCP